MVRAVIAAEDGKFCSHNGFDREAIEQAIERNAKGKKLRGGSTISQQTATNVFLWQGSGWARYVRKVPEVWFTFLIEAIWGKGGAEERRGGKEGCSTCRCRWSRCHKKKKNK